MFRRLSTFILLWICACAYATEAPVIAIAPVWEDPDDHDPWTSILVTECAAQIDIRDGHIYGSYDLTLFNPNEEELEGKLDLLLPDNAVVDGYALDIDGVMVDGVVVERSRAQRILEAEERKRIDPATIELLSGNRFRLRIYPIDEKTTRKVQIKFSAPILHLRDKRQFVLQLPYHEVQDKRKLQVTSDLAVTKLSIGKQQLALVKEASFNAYVKDINLDDLEDQAFVHNEAFADKQLYMTITLAPLRDDVIIVEKNDKGSFAAITTLLPPAPQAARIRKSIAIAWDASSSRSLVEVRKSIAFLELLFKQWPHCRVDVRVFRDKLDEQQTFNVVNADARDLCSWLAGRHRDGGTDLAAVDLRKQHLPHGSNECWLWFCDGVGTTSLDVPQTDTVPVYTISGSNGLNSTVLRTIARQSGGRALYLKQRAGKDSVQALIHPQPTLKRVVTNGVLSHVHAKELGESVCVLGRFIKNGKIELCYALDGKEIKQHIHVADNHKQFRYRIGRSWAREQAEQWSMDMDTYAQAIADLGVEFGIVTASTSMLILEDYDQYLEYGVRPPDTLAAFQKRYDADIADFQEERRLLRKKDAKDKIEEVLDDWKERTDWWQAKHQLPKDWKVPSAKALKEIEDMGSIGRGGGASLFSEGGFDDADVDSEENDAGISIDSWKPDRPYLDILNSLAHDEVLLGYYVLSQSYKRNPSFYFDCAAWFEQQGNRPYAMRALSNLAEMQIEDPRLLRMYAWRLLELTEYDQAISLLKRVCRLRPDDPQSYRHLALAHIERFERLSHVDDAKIACALLYRVVTQYWDRFEGIEMVALMELNRLVAAIKRDKDMLKQDLTFIDKIDKRLLNNLDVDLRICISWDTDNTDIDLHILEPSGQNCYYSENRTHLGGYMSEDFTEGYGPEEYFIRHAPNGSYKIRCNYYASDQLGLTGPATITVTVYRNYGRENESKKKISVRVDKVEQFIKIGEATINKPHHEKQVEAGDNTLEQQPETAEEFFIRGQSRFNAKRYAEARQDLQRALALDPGYGVRGVFKLLDRCADQQKDWSFKMDICKRWAAADADSAPTNNHYAWALLTCVDNTLRDYKLALVLAEKAAQGTAYTDANILDTLALAQFENAMIAEAVATQKKAIALLPVNASRSQRSDFVKRLMQFESALLDAED